MFLEREHDVKLERSLSLSGVTIRRERQTQDHKLKPDRH